MYKQNSVQNFSSAAYNNDSSVAPDEGSSIKPGSADKQQLYP